MKQCLVFLALGTVVSILTSWTVSSQTLFSDGFESGLGLWQGPTGRASYAQVVADPLRAGNMALSFSAGNASGDIFTIQQFALTPGTKYTVTFEYLGRATANCIAGNFGGYAGLSEGFPGRH